MANTVAVFSGGYGSSTWTVPTNCTLITVLLWGGPGGGTTGNGLHDGAGAVGFVQGDLAVTPGDQYTVYAGGAGSINTFNTSTGSGGSFVNGGFNGGGGSGIACGGGGSDIRFGGTALSNRIIVAGGGGGISLVGTTASNPTTPTPPYNTTAQTYETDAYGGDPAGDGYGPYTGVPAGKAGTQTAGGAGGVETYTRSGGVAAYSGADGALGVGGDCPTSFKNGTGGGGGGGYYGGGAGAGYVYQIGSTYDFYSGNGGGGSNYISSSFTNTVDESHTIPADSVDYYTTLYNNGQITLTDYNNIKAALTSGNGVVLIFFDQPPNAPTFTSPTNNGYFDSTQTLEVDWTFSSSVSGQTQGGFDIQYIDLGGGSWTTINQRTNTNGKYVFPAATFVAGHNYEIQVRVYDASGSQGPWGSLFVNALSTPPPGAPTITSPTSGEQFTASPVTLDWTIDAAQTELTYRIVVEKTDGTLLLDTLDQPSTRENLCVNPSFETDATGWSPNTGSPTIASSATYAKYGSKSGAVTWGAGSGGNQSVITNFNTIPGKQYWVSLWLTGNTASDPTSLTVNVTDANGTITSSGATIASTGVFVNVTIRFTARDTVSSVVVVPNGSVTNGTFTYIDGALFELNATNTVRSFFDGGNANGNPGTPSWTGTANDSTSLLTISNVLSYSLTWSWPSEAAKVFISYSTVASAGIESNQTEQDFSVNFNPPGTGSVVVTENDDAGTITLTVTNGSNVATNDIYRTDVTHSLPEIRIAKGLGLNPVFVDYTPATNTLYTYRVRQYSADGGYTDIS